MVDERCKSCGHPVADHGNENQHGTSPGCLLNCRCSLSKDQAVDWKSRCLRAEQEAAALRQERDEYKRSADAYQAVDDVTVRLKEIAESALADRDRQLAAAKEKIAALKRLVYRPGD